MTSRSSRACTSSLALLSISCTGAMDRGAYTVRDSAGIEIIESRAPAWREGSGWRVVEPALVQIGVTEGDERYQLFDAQQVARLSDGTILVLNAGTQEIRFYDATGRFLRSIGGRGRGPGEFQVLELIAVTAGDTILAYNRIPPQLAVFNAAGDLLRVDPVPRPGDRSSFEGIAMPAGILHANRVVLSAQPVAGRTLDFVDGLYRMPWPVAVADVPLARFDSVTTAPGIEVMLEHFGTGVRMSIPPFRRGMDILARDSIIWIAPNDDYTVRMLDAAGRVRRLVRVLSAPVRVTAEHLAAWRADLFARYPDLTQAQRAETERVLAAMPVPETMPAYDGIDVDREGNLWAHAYRLPGNTGPDSVRVFDTRGRWLGDLSLPAGIKRQGQPLPLEIGDDWILGIWTDALDVDYVRLYRLAKGR